jgi:hypothetical protein
MTRREVSVRSPLRTGIGFASWFGIWHFPGAPQVTSCDETLLLFTMAGVKKRSILDKMVIYWGNY